MASKHAPQYRVRFTIDPDGRFEECNGEARPLTPEEYAKNQYFRDGTPIPYAEYLRYYGNPDRHVYLQSEVQRRCPCCEQWQHVNGTGWIDFMDDDPELAKIDTWYDPSTIEGWTAGYLRLIALEDLTDAGYKPPRHIYCAHKGCRFFHVTGSRFCAQHGAPVPA